MKKIQDNMTRLAVLIIMVLSFVFTYSTASAQLTKLNVGYVGINSDNVIAWVAKEAGIFAKNGLDVQLIYFAGGSTSVMALVSGESPIIQTGAPPIVNAVLGGSDPVMIAGGVVTLDYWLLSRPEIKTPEQLKGGAVAISRFGSSSDFIVRYALQKIGLTPVKDVAILQIGALPDRLAAMESKRVQATVLAPPAMYVAQKRGFNILADVAALGLAYQATGVATTRKFIREHPEVVRKYIKAHVDAVHRFKTDRETGTRILAKYLGLKDKEILDKTYEGAIAENKLPAKQYPTLAGIKTIIEADPKGKSSNLSGHFKTGQWWSGQNRPTDRARDHVVLPLCLLIRQVHFCSPTPWAAFKNVTVMEEAVEHCGDGGAVTEQLAPVFHRTVRRHQGAGPLIAPHDDL